MSCTLPAAACLAQIIGRRLAAGCSYVAVEAELYDAFASALPRELIAAAFRVAGDAAWRQQHPELAAEPLADRG
jgi:hypothetical protein